MGWAVVKFLDEDAVEAVPQSWYIEASEECFWPPINYKRDKIFKLIERNGSPLSDWRVYRALMLGYYEEFAVAQRKAKKATVTTDLSSASDIYKGRSRTRKKNPRYEQSHGQSSDSDESHSSNHISYPVFKRTLPLKLLDDKSRSNSPEISRETAETVRSKEISHGSNDVARPKPFSEVTPKSSFAAKQLDTLSNQDFKRMMVDEMNQLNLKMNNVIESIATLMRSKRIETDIQLTSYESKIKILYEKIPVKNEIDLEELEIFLADNENFKIMISELSRIGGSSLGQSVRKILYRLLTDEVALLFSWDGAKLKRPFKNLKLAKCILESMKIQYISSKEVDTILVIKSWLVKSRERMTNLNKKEGKQ